MKDIIDSQTVASLDAEQFESVALGLEGYGAELQARLANGDENCARCKLAAELARLKARP